MSRRIPTDEQKKAHAFKYILLHTFLRERDHEEGEYRKRVEEMASLPETGKQYQAFARLLMIDAYVMKSLLMITDDLEKLWKLPADGIETCIKQIEKEIDGLKQMPDEADALKEAEQFLKYLQTLLNELEPRVPVTQTIETPILMEEETPMSIEE